MSIINTSSFESDLLPGLVKKWFGEHNDLPEIYSQMMKVEASNQAYDILGTLTPMGAAQRKNQGSALTLDTAQEAFKPIFTNLAYALGFEITKEARQDGHAFRDAKRFTEMLKRGCRITKEIVAANILNFAGTSGYTMTGGDGVILASASHPTRAGNQSNILSGGTDLSEAALEAINVQIMNAKDNRGLRIGLMIDKLIISPTQKADAHRILMSDRRVSTADNDANFVNDTNLVKGIVVNQYLTSTTQWQVTTNAPDGLIFKIRQEAEVDTDNVFLTKNSQVSVDMRICAGWGDHKGVYISL